MLRNQNDDNDDNSDDGIPMLEQPAYGEEDLMRIITLLVLS